jgi:hypothetical protein
VKSIFFWCVFRVKYRIFHYNMKLLLKCLSRWNKKRFLECFA